MANLRGEGQKVIAGHFGLAAMVKSRERAVPLWALMLGTVWLDILFVPLFLAGVERISAISGAKSGYGKSIIYADYTHSLAGAFLFSAVFGVAFAIPRGRRCALVLGLVAFSHWLLDLVVHRHDMPLLPDNYGDLPRLGFGLWRFPIASACVELALISAGAWFYWHAAREVARERNTSPKRAVTAGLLVVICGLAVLALDVTGIFG